MSYDPKAKRPRPEDGDEDAAPVDQLLGAPPDGTEPHTAGQATTSSPEPGSTADTGPSTPAMAPEPAPLPASVPTRRTTRNVIAAVVAVVIVLVGWRRRRRRRP